MVYSYLIHMFQLCAYVKMSVTKRIFTLHMSDHPEDLKRGYPNGFEALENSISVLREHINVVKKEPHKIDINEIEKVFSNIETDEKICWTNSDKYIKYLENNQHR